MTDLPGSKPMDKPKDLGKAVEAMKKVSATPKNGGPGMGAHALKGHKKALRAPEIC